MALENSDNLVELEKKSKEGRGAMTTAEAGRIGGRRTAATHGHAFYEEIGRMGGRTVKCS